MIKLTQNKVIALIGMSGAGKTTVSNCFKENGYTVIDCDISAREVTMRGCPALHELARELSDEIILSDGSLDRKKTAELIFNNAEKRAVFNRIIYPYITYNVMCKVKYAENDILLDAPTLYDAKLEGICDHIVSVCADRALCLERIMNRDSISKELAAARLDSQRDKKWFLTHSDHCIINNGTKEELIKCAQNIISELKGQ